MRNAIFVLVNFICLLVVVLIWYHGEVKYLESKVDYFDRLAEEYREILHKNIYCQEFPWYTLYGKGEKMVNILPEFE